MRPVSLFLRDPIYYRSLLSEASIQSAWRSRGRGLDPIPNKGDRN
jgi:hypothetical protein